MSAWTSARLGQVQTSPWFSANITKPSIALSKKSSSSAVTSLKKMFGDLPPSSSVTGMRFWLAYCMISRPVVVSPVKAILAMRGLGGQRLAGFEAKAVDDVEDAGRQEVADDLGPDHDRGRRLLGGLEHHAIAGGERGRELPAGHQQREVPGDDLADDAERLVEMIGDGVVVDLADRAFLGAHARRRNSGSDRSPAAGRRRGSRGSACRCPRSRQSRGARDCLPCGRRSCSGSRRARRRWCGPRRPWRHARRRARLDVLRCRSARSGTRSGRSPARHCRNSGRQIGATNLPPMKLS